MRCIKEVCELLSSFNKEFNERRELKQILKKIEMAFQKQTTDPSTTMTVKSVNSDRQSIVDCHWLNNRFNYSIKLIEVEDHRPIN